MQVVCRITKYKANRLAKHNKDDLMTLALGESATVISESFFNIDHSQTYSH